MELIIIGLAIAVGVAWWMYNNHDKVEDIVEEVEDAVDEIEDKIDEVKQKVKDKLDDIPTKDELKKLREEMRNEPDDEVRAELAQDIEGLKNKKEDWAKLLGLNE